MRATSLKLSKRQGFYLLSFLSALAIYPLFVLIYTWSHVASSSFEGGKNGPLDAYRHTLASAVVAYTLNDHAVMLVTNTMERSNSGPNRMDRHNNMVGMQLSHQAKSFFELEPLVRQTVAKGSEKSTLAHQVTWLPKRRWGEAWLW